MKNNKFEKVLKEELGKFLYEFAHFIILKNDKQPWANASVMKDPCPIYDNKTQSSQYKCTHCGECKESREYGAFGLCRSCTRNDYLYRCFDENGKLKMDHCGG